MLEGTSTLEYDKLDRTALFWSAYYGNTTCLKAIADQAKTEGKLSELINKGDNKGRTPIYIAAFCGHVEVIHYLIEQTKNNVIVDAATNENHTVPGFTPLIAACQEGQQLAVQVLINAGADVRRQDKEGGDCAYMAALSNHVNVLKVVLPQHPDLLRRKLYASRNILHAASIHGSLQAVEYILPNGGLDIINEEDTRGFTALELAAYFGRLPVVNELVKNHANIQHTANGKTARQWAEDRGHTEIVKYLENLATSER